MCFKRRTFPSSACILTKLCTDAYAGFSEIKMFHENILKKWCVFMCTPAFNLVIRELKQRHFWTADFNRKFMFLLLARFHARPMSYKPLILAFTTWLLNEKGETRIKEEKSRLPVDVRGSKTSVLKLPTNPNGRPMLPFDWLIHSSNFSELPSCCFCAGFLQLRNKFEN